MTNKPFSMPFVLKETVKHMRKSIDISTQKTIARLPEFKDNSELVAEVMTTLTNLNRLNKLLDDIENNNTTLFGDTEK
jgi:hypothetical protein